MQLTIDLSEHDAAALDERARAAHVPREQYVARILERVLHGASPGEQTGEQRPKAKKSAYGLLTKYGPGPTESEIDENRKEMFQGFGDLAP